MCEKNSVTACAGSPAAAGWLAEDDVGADDVGADDSVVSGADDCALVCPPLSDDGAEVSAAVVRSAEASPPAGGSFSATAQNTTSPTSTAATRPASTQSPRPRRG